MKFLYANPILARASTEDEMRFKRSWLPSICTVALFMLLSPSLQASVIYAVNLNGSTIDLAGFIEVNGIGSFSPTAFDAQVVNYSIMASQNGAFPFTFTAANSGWGGPVDPLGNLFGTLVQINVAANAISVLAPLGGIDLVSNLFLVADAITNQARENLTFAVDTLRYKLPGDPNSVIFETVGSPFVLATAIAVSEPSTLFLLAVALLGLQRARKYPASKVSAFCRRARLAPPHSVPRCVAASSPI